MKNIEEYIEINYKNKIDIKNIKEINNNDNIELDLKEKCDIYLELKKFDNGITEKMNYFKINDEKFTELKNSITNNENNINDLINKIEEQIKKSAELIKLSDIFNDYKKELLELIKNDKSEYKEKY